LCFHALRDHSHIQAMRHGYDRGGYRGIRGNRRNACHKGPINLQGLDREAFQLTQ